MKKLTRKHKKNISKAMTGNKNPFYGRKHSEETRKKISEAARKRNSCGKNNIMNRQDVKEKHLLACRKESHCRKISMALTGRKRPDQSKFMKKNNPMFTKSGKKNWERKIKSEEYRKRMSISCKEAWTDDIKKKASVSMGKMWKSKEYREKRNATLLKRGLKVPDNKLPALTSYRRKVGKYTNRSIKRFYRFINPKNKQIGRDKYQIDHIFSVVAGFNKGVDPKIIGSAANLQVLHCSENGSKKTKCWITIEELRKKYEMGSRLFRIPAIVREPLIIKMPVIVREPVRY